LAAQSVSGAVDEVEYMPPAAAEKRLGRSLDPAEFAAFLQRSAEQHDPGAG
jgi:hypothetical protein